MIVDARANFLYNINMKLYGKELEDELTVRRKAKEERLFNRLTLRQAAKTNNMGLTPSEYCDWERGADVCPHEEIKKSLGGVHKPFLLMNVCKKCGKVIGVIGKIEKEEDFDKYKDDLEEALKTIK